MIKSARVMKKAVGYLIPFMEKEREERLAQMNGEGNTVEDSLAVSEKVKFCSNGHSQLWDRADRGKT